ncbi:hypothetical protein LHV13_02145 [Ferrovum sp. PN-J185]|uniref:hypothetical protein n=1 Tax=Ferrovum sp. PN-J185 TaxID=1356306 RepID=UPI001E631353|nr:hypothetical protein [Ferrovum sp. PN-J185]MCC6067982.1 hypothetical protein [Ferrovum sp. PN-J185]
MFSKNNLVLAMLVLAGIGLTSCGGGSSSSIVDPAIDYLSSYDSLNCVAGPDTVGVWKTVTNNKTSIPNDPNYFFFSYNQPSINKSGMVTFRGRSKNNTSQNSSIQQNSNSNVIHGVYAVQPCLTNQRIYRVADNNTIVPAPNTQNAAFTEFPSIPRIDINSGVIGTRGMSQSLYILPDGTKIGNSGVYTALSSGLTTAIGQFAVITDYSYMQVPNATSTIPISFDQFPGSPTVTNNIAVFKGNYTDTDSTGASVSKTGIYYRNLSQPSSNVEVIADTNMLIPNTSQKFGSTAPPSSALGKVVFLGVDNEASPTVGGIYMSNISTSASLISLIKIGDSVPDQSGNPITNLTFTQFGEALSFDGRYVSFWGAWGNQQKAVQLECPVDGNKDLIQICKDNSVNNITTQMEPINQGIFVYDTQQSKTWMVATSDTTLNGQFSDFLYWTFSGDPKINDGEPPRWRASIFTSVDGNRGVIFKGSLLSTTTVTAPPSGLYGSKFNSAGLNILFKLMAVGDDMSSIDSTAPTGSTITSIGIERESLRSGWLVVTVSSNNSSNESWAGIYATNFQNPFNLGTTTDSFGMVSLTLK